MSWVAVAVAVVGAGASVYSSNKASKASKSASKNALKSQEDMLKETKPYGGYYSQQGKNIFGQVVPYYQNILSGDRYRTQEAMAPELNSIANKYKGSYSAARSMYPRGSGLRAGASANMPFQAAGEQTNLMMGSRGEAARALTGIGTQMAGLGLNAYGLQSNISNGLLDYGARNKPDYSGAGSMFYNSMMGGMNAYMNRPQNTTTQLPVGRGLTTQGPGVNYGGQVSGIPSNPYMGGQGPGVNYGTKP